MVNRKKILIIGGAGFIGEAIYNYLPKDQILVADIKKGNVNAKYCDILKPDSIDDVISDEVDIVMNLADFANITKANQDPINVMNLNVIGNMNILEACKKNNINHFIYASSAYAVSESGGFYSTNKDTSEKIVREYHKQYGVNYLILRLGSIYGAMNYENNYLYNLIRNAMLTKRIDHKGTGNEMRDYLYIDDAVQIIASLIYDNQKWNGTYFIMGNEKVKRKDIFHVIEEALNEKILISYTNEKTINYSYTPFSIDTNDYKRIQLSEFVDINSGVALCVKKILLEMNDGKNTTIL